MCVGLPETLPRTRLRLAEAEGIDLADRRVSYVDPQGKRGHVGYDRLVISVGSVNKLLPILGVVEYAHGFRGCSRGAVPA